MTDIIEYICTRHDIHLHFYMENNDSLTAYEVHCPLCRRKAQKINKEE